MTTLAEAVHAPLRGAEVKYRPDLDGLRAVAILLVLADHLKSRFTGGYVGVDVFFVLSGYLISKVLFASFEAGTFSIVEFYERRARRILPALLLMMVIVSVFAYFNYTPYEVQALGFSLIATLFSVSNLLFYHQAGYFAAASEYKPLLHTWSLGVEEQFYIFFPVFLFAVRRWLGQRMQAAIWTVLAISFVLACYLVHRDAAMAFFFAPFRAWELLLGTLLSQRYLPAIEGSKSRNLATATGLFLIVVPALLYTADTSFPGLAALPACLGAALIIAGGECGPSFVSRLLSLAPVTFVGKISYSLYLWHWPLLVFQNTANILHLPVGGHGVALTLATISVAVATLSWALVETPFRNRNFQHSPHLLLIELAAAALLVATAAFGMIYSHGLPSRFPSAALRVARFMQYSEIGPYREGSCFLVSPQSTFSDFNPEICLKTEAARVATPKQYLLLGDSHAAAIYPGLAGVYPEANILQATAAGCKPLLPNGHSKGNEKTCKKLLDFIFNGYLASHHPDAILLAGRWSLGDAEGLGATVKELQLRGLRVVLFGPSIEYDAPLPRVLMMSLRAGTAGDVEHHRASSPQQVDAIFKDRNRHQWGAEYISMYDDLCTPPAPGGYSCPYQDSSGTPLLFDSDHLTTEGSVLFARAMRSRHQLE